MQTKDGKRKDYPHICHTFQSNANYRSEMEFKGRVTSLIGCSITNDNVNRLGIIYIPLPENKLRLL